MIRCAAQGVLLDIEGTTSSIRFVYDTMFPYVRRELRNYLASHRTELASEETPLRQAAEQIARDAQVASFDELVQHSSTDAEATLAAEVERQMDADLKATGLKELQGLIWKSGFESGELQGHLYPEVADCLRQWHAAGLVLRIYSSGSIAAQQLFFGNSQAGDLLPLFAGHDDTTIGAKKEAGSYQAICHKFKLAPEHVVFLSDSIAELDAAAAAGLQVVWSCRPENPPAENPANYPAITSFSELEVFSSVESAADRSQ